MKKILNKTEDIVREMIEGMVLANPELTCISEKQIILKKEINKDKVTLISGGGSGHEPAHAGYIGKGLLDAVVCGQIFSSPTPDMIEKAIKKTKSNKGTLLIVKNYSGDVMNFEIAKTLAKTAGIGIEMVIVNDDAAIEDSTYTTGRRGIAGTIFVHKIVGAAAETGMSLKNLKALAEKVIKNVRTIAIALDHCTNPTSAKPSFFLKDDEIEIGLGIHGEPGIKKDKIANSAILVKKMINFLFKDYQFENSKVALLINGLGGTPLMELYIANNDANKYLKSKKTKILWNDVGNFMTSLEMPGFSISLLKLDNQMEKLLKLRF